MDMDSCKNNVSCGDCRLSTFYYKRFDNQYVCRKNMDKYGRIPEQDLKGHSADFSCGSGEPIHQKTFLGMKYEFND